MTLSILIWIPLAISLLASALPARAAGRVAIGWSVVTLGIAVDFLVRFKVGAGGLQFVTDKVWISSVGIH
jgi:NADH:ubiquinone oxidoreductase subunit 4 (subunit M)